MKDCLRIIIFIGALALIVLHSPAAQTENKWDHKPAPEEALQRLKKGNVRFIMGESTFPHLSKERLVQAASENQADHAFATIVSGSDSRVPVELIFDAGVMDLFVVRVAGNVCNTDQLGSVEYGLAHVYTPVLVILGHTHCGVVKAVTREVQGRGMDLEDNIPPMVASIVPAVERSMHHHSDLDGDSVVPYAIEENVYESIRNVVRNSPASRSLISAGKVKVVGAIYDLETGAVRWLPDEKVTRILDDDIQSEPKKHEHGKMPARVVKVKDMDSKPVVSKVTKNESERDKDEPVSQEEAERRRRFAALRSR